MAHLSSEKFNVAWFKLAEFVGRKEKERALTLYRLLVHSLPDGAFAAQLEGDLLLAFKDDKAIEAYKRSAQLYEDAGRYMEAALIYEQLVSLMPQSCEIFQRMLNVYKIVAHEFKIVRCAATLIRLLLQKDQAHKAQQIIASLTASGTISAQGSAALEHELVKHSLQS